MLASLGKGLDDLFADIPKEIREKAGFKLPAALSEPELLEELKNLSKKNVNSEDFTSFLGGGSYNHFIPSAVSHITSRAEFYTAYTPYQPEISQGTLQAIFEYQSMLCELTGMDIANASMYDGATAMAEAASLAVHFTNRKKIIVSSTVHPHYRQALQTYARAASWEIEELPHKDGVTDLASLKLADTVAAVMLSQPNFFGAIEPILEIANQIHANKSLFIVNADPISLGMLKPPGEYGADIVIGEGQSLGNLQSFGGPSLGIFAAKQQFLRFMPGRIIGETVDNKGQRAFVMTMQTREQHIRREKAASNICSNEALCALSAAVYLALMGKTGLKQAAELCLQKANYAKEQIKKIPGFSVPFNAPTFKEFAIKCPIPPQELNKKLLKNKIIGGLDLGKYYPELENHMLLCVTETIKKQSIDQLVSILARD